MAKTRWPRLFPTVPGSFQRFPAVPNCSRQFPAVPGSFQPCQTVSNGFRQFAAVSGGPFGLGHLVLAIYLPPTTRFASKEVGLFKVTLKEVGLFKVTLKEVGTHQGRKHDSFQA